MSADNYLHILKRDGKYLVENRSASCYYADEGHTVESLQSHYDSCEPGKWVIDETWIIQGEPRGAVFENLEDAEAYAYSEYSEYGVSYGFPVRRVTVELDSSAAAVRPSEGMGAA